jgi:hypothetical protein
MLFPVTIEIKPSRRLRAALVFVHLAALSGLVTTLGSWWLALAVPLLLVSLMHALKGLAPVRLTLRQDGTAALETPDGAAVECEVLPGSTTFNWLMVCRVRLANAAGKRALVVLKDSVPEEGFRRLQVWLRWVRSIRPAEDAD